MSALSWEIGRQVGILLDRKGAVESVIVGDAASLHLPDLGRQRVGRQRFRGIRLVHTHLKGEDLTRDDLTDLSRLRLDLVAALILSPNGHPPLIQAAHLLPENSSGDLWRKLPSTPLGSLDVDFQALIHALEGEFARADRTRGAGDKEKAILVHVSRGPRAQAEASLNELDELAYTAGVEVLAREIQIRPQPDPKSLMGKGKLEELVLSALQLGAEILIFDCDLSPGQIRTIGAATDLKILDRTQLILDIFAQRAKSRDGKLQVELAQLKYALPRLVEKDNALSRLTGGIGGRGPGETKLELGRRRVRERIHRLEKEIDRLSAQRQVRRSRRAQSAIPVVSIVGYTNAGKSTLLNAMTRSEVLAEDKLFATLDPTSRRVRFPEQKEIILTDTVGFIRNLPKDLINAFRATLEELEEADLLLHLVDISEPSWEKRIQQVDRIIEDLNLIETPRILVFNKIDRLPPGEAERIAAQFDAVPISALKPETLNPLLERILRTAFRKVSSLTPEERESFSRV